MEVDANKETLDNNKDYQEWKECNDKITKLDTILIDLRRYGFTVASGLMTAGSFLGLQTFTQFQPFQIVIIFATMALIDVLYWLDVYYQTILTAVILRTQVLEKKLSLGVDIYISRFYMRHKIGKALHLLYIGFLASLTIIGSYVVYINKLDYTSQIILPIWILILCIPIIFVFCIWIFFDRNRYKTYSKAQAIISNFLRSFEKPPVNETIDKQILEFLDSDKEDLGLDLKADEWVYYDETGSCRGWCTLWSHRIIVTDKRIYGIETNPIRHSARSFEYGKIEFDKREKRNNKYNFYIIPSGSKSPPAPQLTYFFKIEISQDKYEQIAQIVTKMKEHYYLKDSKWW